MAQVTSSPQPVVRIDLAKFGWMPAKTESNRAFFKDYSLAKLEALDPNTKISFLSDDVIVPYHTKQEGQDWRTATRQLEAFFISAKDGSLLSMKRWPTVVRGSGSDLQDSEGRLIQLSNGRFLAFANHTMMLYGSNFELAAQKKLEPSSLSDLWSAQSVAGGHKIFLRHQSASDQETTYYWLASDTLLPIAQMPGVHGPNFSTMVAAGEDFVLTHLGFAGVGETTGVATIGLDGSARIICSDQFCRGAGGVGCFCTLCRSFWKARHRCC